MRVITSFHLVAMSITKRAAGALATLRGLSIKPDLFSLAGRKGGRGWAGLRG